MASGWIWLIAAVLLAIAELIVPGVFLIWLGAAALVTGAIALAVPLTVPLELALFALTAGVAVVAGRSVMSICDEQAADSLRRPTAQRKDGTAYRAQSHRSRTDDWW